MPDEIRTRDNRFRRDDDYDNPPPPDDTGTILATILGIWAAIIGTIGLVGVLVVLVIFAIIFLLVCIWLSVVFALFSAVASNMPPPGPPATAVVPNEIPNPRPIDPNWNDDAMQRTWLSDMNEFGVRVGYGRFGKRGHLGYGVRPGEADSPITFRGQRYPQAISAAAPSSVKYRLDGQMRLFKASVACNDLDPGVAGPNQPMTFKVYGDGELLWASDPLSRVGVKQDVRVSVAGVQELELRVDCAANGNARAIWLDPQVLK
jgi:hypothetical protein